jgi:hypothetical protein
MRSWLFVALAILTLAVPARAVDEPVDLQWENLVPGLQTFVAMGLVQHGQNILDIAPDAIAAAGTVKDFDGKRVAIAGFIVPLDLDATTVKEFLLVPYIGACIHVPPPPPNQVIYVRSEKGVKITGLFDAVTVTGVLGQTEMTTELADVGYRINADKVEAYEFKF